MPFLVTPGSALAATSSMCVEGASPCRRARRGAGRPRPLSTPPRCACPAVALRYVAEVGLYARFPVHVQLSDRVLLCTARSSRKHRSLIGRSVSPGVGGNGENALARLGEIALAESPMCDGEIGCFYSSANKRARSLGFTRASFRACSAFPHALLAAGAALAFAATVLAVLGDEPQLASRAPDPRIPACGPQGTCKRRWPSS